MIYNSAEFFHTFSVSGIFRYCVSNIDFGMICGNVLEQIIRIIPCVNSTLRYNPLILLLFFIFRKRCDNYRRTVFYETVNIIL